MAVQQSTPLGPHVAPLCGPNVAGLQECLRVFPVSNVAAVPFVLDGRQLGDLQLRDPLNYADLWFQAGSGQYEEPQDDNEQGDIYQQKLTAVVPRDAPDVAAAVARYRELRYFVALYLDANGFTRLVGTPDYPLRFSAALSTGQRPGPDRNGYALTLAASSPVPAQFYQHFELPAAGTRRVFSAGFSFGFQRTP